MNEITEAQRLTMALFWVSGLYGSGVADGLAEELAKAGRKDETQILSVLSWVAGHSGGAVASKLTDWLWPPLVIEPFSCFSCGSEVRPRPC